jgi:tetratricopeptide (TPR) repeat protein
VAFRQGDWTAAQSYHEQSLALRRRVGDRWGTAASLSNLAMVPYQQRDYAQARQYWEEALQVRRRLGDSLGLAGLLDNLALVVVAQKEFPAARALIEEAVSIREQLGDRQGLAITLSNRGRLGLLEGELAAAETDYRASLEIAQEIGDQIGLVFGLAGVAGVWAGAGKYDAAVRLLAAAAAHLGRIGGVWESDEKAVFDTAREQAEGALTAEAFAAAWEAGGLLSAAEAVREVYQSPTV